MNTADLERIEVDAATLANILGTFLSVVPLAIDIYSSDRSKIICKICDRDPDQIRRHDGRYAAGVGGRFQKGRQGGKDGLP
jgi:hypothetical protein